MNAEQRKVVAKMIRERDQFKKEFGDGSDIVKQINAEITEYVRQVNAQLPLSGVAPKGK